MFKIDRQANRLIGLERTTFAEAGLRERDHLQEWLAASPEALGETIGEELLIVQKEFDGFDGTRERLDLLALDQNGQLVIIENKLDDSGREVVWQALKYAAYCSSLRKAEIITIYQQYLDSNGGGDAASNILDFLQSDSLDEVVLNEGNDQRVVFIAGGFRREVTATVLWLREHQIDARCVKVVPYSHGEEILLDVQQVIPTPEAADYMIRMAEKDSEEKNAKGVQRWSHQMRLAFWEQLLSQFRDSGLERWQNISPSRDHWLTSRFGVAGCNLVLIFLRGEIRVELQINRTDPEENKRIFDALKGQESEIESGLNCSLYWRRNDKRRVSIIESKKSVQGYSDTNWPDMIDWLEEHYRAFERVLVPRLDTLVGSMKSSGALDAAG